MVGKFDVWGVGLEVGVQILRAVRGRRLDVGAYRGAGSCDCGLARPLLRQA